METNLRKIIVAALLVTIVAGCSSSLETRFKNPPNQYKPMPFWHINGELTTEGIRQQMKDACNVGFTGVSLLPLASKENRPGTSPEFLSDEYFDRFQDMLDVAEELDMEVISSAADYYDRPLVSTEIYGAFREESFDSLMLYRPMMELFARGVNFVIPHGMWYNPKQVYIQPLVSPYSEKLKPALPAYSEFVGRTCLLLQGGRRVSEIGLIYPFEELAGWFRFDNPEGIRQGFYISPETDYQLISGLLTNKIRRDFTFVHPEFFLEDKYQIENGTVKLNNTGNFQEYRTMFLTGCNTISYKTLEKLKTFYENGGTVISTTQLPHKSSELGADEKVIALVNEIFGANPLETDSISILTNENSKGGKAIFIPVPSKETLHAALSVIPADVQFEPNPASVEFGKFSYIHKIKNGKNIYYFANSSNEIVDTEIWLRGKLNLKRWNPHSGEITTAGDVSYEVKNGETYTKCSLHLKGVQSVFFLNQ